MARNKGHLACKIPVGDWDPDAFRHRDAARDPRNRFTGDVVLAQNLHLLAAAAEQKRNRRLSAGR